MPILLLERPALSVNDVEIVAVNFQDHLNPGEVITDLPTVEEVTSDDLVIADILINTDSYVEAFTGDTVEPGQAVLFTLSCATAGTYTIRVTVDTEPAVTTSYTPASRHFVRDIWIQFK